MLLFPYHPSAKKDVSSTFINLNCVPTTLMINESLLGNPIESSKVESDTSNTRSLRGGGHRNHLHFRKVTWIPQKKIMVWKRWLLSKYGHVWHIYSMIQYVKFLVVQKIHTPKKGAVFSGWGESTKPTNQLTTSTVGVHLKGVFEFLGHLQEPGWIWWMDMMDGYDATKKIFPKLTDLEKKPFKTREMQAFC